MKNPLQIECRLKVISNADSYNPKILFQTAMEQKCSSASETLKLFSVWARDEKTSEMPTKFAGFVEALEEAEEKAREEAAKEAEA